MKVQIPSRIRAEDFKPEEQEMVGKLSGTISNFLDEVYRALNKGIDFENLNRQVVDLDVTIDSSGRLVNSNPIKNLTSGRLKGLHVISAVNLNNPGVYPTTAPFVSWNINNNLINILNVTGLQINSQYRLTLELMA